MLNRLPEQVEPLRLAEVGRAFRGEVAVSRLTRLAPDLRSRAGAIQVELHFGRDERCLYALTGSIQGTLELTCQRCLEPVAVPLDIRLKLGIVASEDDAERLPEGYEVLLAGRDPIVLSELVEDEIILALPLIPRHSDAAHCGMQREEAARLEQKISPFAVLEELKHKP
jgi:DUF177 domain-containing protein